MISNTLQTKVAETGITQLIQRLGRDCTPEQFVREFVQNSIEAIQRTNMPGQVVVDANWDLYESLGAHKMTFVDTGDGMTCEEMISHLNSLSSSGHADNVYENYGVGAKIASLTRNHAGLIYESWKGGVGNRIVIFYDDSAKCYGVMPVELDNGDVKWCVELDDSQKPKEIDDHGTKVTLMGMTAEQDTMVRPSSSKGIRESWLALYINTRYYLVPDDISVRVRIGYYRDKSNSRHNYLREITGQKNTLDSNSESKGSLNLTDAKVHWWILKEGADGHGRELLNGHTGVLNQNELFDIGENRSNKAPAFGIIVGKESIVLYVEPSASSYVQNTARTGIVQHDGSPLPWDRWQDEFREKMPKEIQEFINMKMNAITSQSHEESIRERLKNVAKFFKISRYRKHVDGGINADPNSESLSNVGNVVQDHVTQKGGRRKREGDLAGSLEEILMTGLKQDGVRATEVQPDKFPKLIWCQRSDGTRNEEDMEDRAAQYIPQTNTIRGNADFLGFQDIIKHYMKEYENSSNESPEIIIKDTVLEAFEQQLIETVMGALSLKNRPQWNPDEFEKAVSEESLTTAVMPRFFIMNQIKRNLGSKLGGIKKAS